MAVQKSQKSKNKKNLIRLKEFKNSSFSNLSFYYLKKKKIVKIPFKKFL